MSNIKNQESTSLVKEYYLNYAKYSLTSRSIPSIIDGFKAGQRRLIYCASKLPNGKLIKSSKIVGDTLPYHPHSPDSLYGTLVGLTTPTNNFRQFEGNGNWGGPGSGAAAMRYTEAMLNEVAKFCYTQFVDYADYEVGESDLNEPVALPALVPYSNIKGSTGIAVGLATNIMPLNIMEIIDYCIAKLKGKPTKMPTPDFGDFIIDMEDQYIDEAVSGYYGRVWIKSNIIQEGNKLVIHDLFVGKGKGHRSLWSILDNLGDLINSGKVDFRDETTTSVRYVFEVMDDSVNIQDLKNRLSRMTAGSQAFSRIVVEGQKGVFCSFDYQMEATLNYLRKVLERKISIEIDKFKKEEQVLLVIDYIKTSGILDKISKMSSQELKDELTGAGFDSDSVSSAISKSISYLTKSHDKELEDLRERIQSHQNIDITDYMINLYKEFKKVLKPLYNQYPHSVRRSSLLENPKIRYNEENNSLVISDGDGVDYSGTAYIAYPDGSVDRYYSSSDSRIEIQMTDKIIGVATSKYIALMTSNEGLLVFSTDKIWYKRSIVHLHDDITVVHAGNVDEVDGKLIFEYDGNKYDVTNSYRSKYSYPNMWWKDAIV